MERNHQTLRNTVSQLPDYQPDPSVWNAIERRLATRRSQEQLQATIQQLPTYAPSAELWKRIAAELEQPPQRQLRTAHRTWLSLAAAVILVAISLVVWLQRTPTPPETVQMLYATAESNTIVTDWDEDEAAIETVANIFARRASLLPAEQRQTMIAELQELNEAKAAIQSMIKKYGLDAQLVKNMVEIERQRSEIIKRMAQEI